MSEIELPLFNQREFSARDWEKFHYLNNDMTRDESIDCPSIVHFISSAISVTQFVEKVTAAAFYNRANVRNVKIVTVLTNFSLSSL